MRAPRNASLVIMMILQEQNCRTIINQKQNQTMHRDVTNSRARLPKERIQSHDDRNPPAPKKTTIHLKRREQIPQIKIKLDELLTDAYTAISTTQSHVNNLSNSLLTDYIYYIYGEYNIPDPLQAAPQNRREVFDGSSSHNKSANLDYRTPKKASSFRNYEWETADRIKESRSKTFKKITMMKNEMQKELNTEHHIDRERDYETSGRILDGNAQTLQERKFPLNRAGRKLKIKLVDNSGRRKYAESQIRREGEGSKVSHLLEKGSCHYCLMCEEPLENNLITEHEKKCIPLKNFLKSKVLSRQEIIEILNGKIQKLQKQLFGETSNFDKDAKRLQVKFGNIMQRSEQLNISEERQEMKEFVSSMRFLKCWEKMDKLCWFKVLRGRAYNDKVSGLTY